MGGFGVGRRPQSALDCGAASPTDRRAAATTSLIVSVSRSVALPLWLLSAAAAAAAAAAMSATAFEGAGTSVGHSGGEMTAPPAGSTVLVVTGEGVAAVVEGMSEAMAVVVEGRAGLGARAGKGGLEVELMAEVDTIVAVEGAMARLGAGGQEVRGRRAGIRFLTGGLCDSGILKR